MFITTQFWFETLLFILLGFLINHITKSKNVMIYYIIPYSFYVIFNTGNLTFAVFVSFITFSIFIDQLNFSELSKCFLKIVFLLIIKLLFILNLFEMLPLGISFIVFQSISYSLDKRKFEGKILGNSLKYTNFVSYLSLFPQVISGPIIKFRDFTNQTNDLFEFDRKKIDRGIIMITIGLIFKNYVSDFITNDVKLIFFDISEKNVLEVFFGSALFGLQIYADFCGYSLIALGLLSIIGLKFPKNFNYPYLCCSLSDFWRCWHISLGRFFHEYMYKPLLNKKIVSKSNAILLVFLTSGIWHGIGLNFIIWGLFHGIALLIENSILKPIKGNFFFGRIYTLMIVIFGWTLFRIEDFSSLKNISFEFDISNKLVLKFIFFTIIVGILDLLSFIFLDKYDKVNLIYFLVFPILLCLAVSSIFIGLDINEFIYFQF